MKARRFGRRDMIAIAAAVPCSGTRASALADAPLEGVERFEKVDLRLEGAIARRACIWVPKTLDPSAGASMLVLLHGRGETTDETAGVNAWADRYGLLSAYARLAEPPVAPRTPRGDLPSERARSMNEELSARPFGGRTIFVCPFTPNVFRLPNVTDALNRYADWIADGLLPHVRERVPKASAAARAGIDGCSLGGFIGLEVFLRRPESFVAWGGVQSAFGAASAERSAERVRRALEQVGRRKLHVETSSADPFRASNVALSGDLRKRGIAHDLSVLPGPHDQAWLREAGTIEMLLWHDRALSSG